MQYIEGFRRERESSASAYFQFVFAAPKYPNDIHAFFEGHDDLSFYVNFLRSFATNSKSIHVYKCGNKKGVYEAHEKVINGVRQGVVLFFVDKDLSDVLNEVWEQASDIYTTDYYSIENYLVSEDMLFRIWTELFRFRGVELDFEQVHREKFHTELGRFYQYTRPMMAWIIYLRRKGLRPNANNISFTKFFDWDTDLTLIKSKQWQDGGLTYLERICGVQTPDTWGSETDAVLKELSILAPKTYIRGKLELCFFVRFVERLMRILDNHLPGTDAGVMTKTLLSEENAIEVLGPRLSIPPSLERFLQDNCHERQFKR